MKRITGLTTISAGLLLALSLAVAQPLQPSGAGKLPDGAVAYRDLAYVVNGHQRQKLDLFLPKDGTNLPLIINIHGGAFRMGSKEMGVPLEYLSQGYAVASITYVIQKTPPFLICHGDTDPLVPHH